MFQTYQYPQYSYRQSEEQQTGTVKRHKVVVIGAGPIGLTAALDFTQRGIPTVVLDDNNTVSIGSRAVCYAKRPLEIWDRLGCATRMIDKGIEWKIGKVFFRDDLAYTFDLLPEDGHKIPAFINLQQYYLEEYMVDEAQKSNLIDLRWKHKLLNLQQGDDHVVLTVETPDGVFKMEADWVVACDGANSDTRKMVGAGFSGQFFQDRFLIADIIMKADFPTERWFWFDPPFHRGSLLFCTSSATMSGGWIFSLAGRPIRKRRKSRKTSFRASRRCWERTRSSSWNGPPSTSSPAGGSITSVMAGYCSRVMLPIRFHPSAHAAPTQGCRTSTIWAGS